MSSNQQLVDRAANLIVQNYGRLPLVMVRGEGSYVWDADGRRYLDLFAGFGGAILGHSHPALIDAAAGQARKLWHVGNAFYNDVQIDFAERLARTAFAGRAFFCHSGAEANEAACKLARLRGSQTGRWKIISLNQSFHGRTLAMLAATGNPKYREGFGPVVPGFSQVNLGDIDALKAAVDRETAGIIMEPIQGEGGINIYPADYPARVRELCDQNNMTLIFDEVWTGCGRTGKWFAHQHCVGPKDGVQPDIMTLGKAVGGGLPVGVMWARPELAKLLVPGTHGCTLGGNAICMAVARTVFDVIEKDGLLGHAAKLGDWAMARLRSSHAAAAKIHQVRGKGLFIGIELKTPPEKLFDKAAAAGLLVNVTASKVIRLAPPVNIPDEAWEAGVNALIDLVASL